MEGTDKPVDFEYCVDCKHFTKLDTEEPCDDCLNEFTNTDSHKPVYFEPKNK